MTNPTHIYSYNYEALDALLRQEVPPEACWRYLDAALHILATTGLTESGPLPSASVAELYSELRVLRDVFGEMKPAE